MLMCLRWLSLCLGSQTRYAHLGFSDRMQNSWFHDHHTTCLTVSMVFFFMKCCKLVSLCVLFGQQKLPPWNSPIEAIEAWGNFRCCSGLFYFYKNYFGRPATSGKVPCFFHFCICALCQKCVSVKSFSNDSVTLSWMIHVNLRIEITLVFLNQLLLLLQ